MIKLAIRTVRYRRNRMLLTMLSIVLGVGFMTATLSLSASIRRGSEDTFASVASSSDLLVRSKPAFDQDGAAAVRNPMPESTLTQIRAVVGVDAAVGAVSGDGIVGSTGPTGWSSGAIIHSADGIGSLSPFTVSAGRAPAGPAEVLLDAGTARSENVELGEEVSVQSTTAITATVVGLASLGDQDHVPGQALVLLDLAAAQELLGRPGSLDEILVTAAAPGSTELEGRIRRSLPPRLEVLTSSAVAQERADGVGGAGDIVTVLLGGFAVIALFVGGFVILNTFTVIIAQRTRETGLLRAVGASTAQVTSAVVVEALVVGAVSSAVGAIAGIGMAVGLRWLTDAIDAGLPDGGLVVRADTVFAPIALGVGVTLLASYIPARRAGRLSPMAALRDVDRRVVIGRIRIGAGTALAVAAPVLGVIAIPAGIVAATLLAPALVPAATQVVAPLVRRVGGLSGRLGSENALRNPIRTGATASALMVGLSLVVGMTVVADSALSGFSSALDGSLRADLIVSSRQADGISTDLAEDLADLPEVASVSPQRYGQFELVDIDETATPEEAGTQDLSAVDPETYGNAFDLGLREGTIGDLADGGVIVLDDIAQRQGWQVGDTIRMRFAKAGVQDVEIDGIYTEGTLESQGFMLSLADHERFYSEQLDARVFLTVAGGSSIEAARDAVEQAASAFPGVDVDTADSFIAEVTSSIDLILAAVNVLLGLAVLIAVLGIVNTLALSMYERTRELGLVRAIGMSQTQVRSMVRWEAMIMSLLGSALALVVGVLVGRALLAEIGGRFGDQVTLPVGRLAGFVALGALVGLAAAILPARRAARTGILDALRTA